MNLDFIFFLPGLVIGLTLHECAHATTAAWLGDRYAASQGRVSLNPFRHLSFWGTLALFVLGFGWGKPVPVNLYNFRHPKRDFLLTSLAGPASNLLLCAVSLGLVYLNFPWWIDSQLRMLFLINAMLAVFNLVPIPPLDGSRIWPCVIPGMKPVASGKWSLIWMIVLVYVLMSGKISGVIHPVLESAIRLLPHHAPLQQSRPEGFPLELMAPQDSMASYSVWPMDSPDPNQFRILFDSEESFPPNRLITFVRSNFQRQNWIQLDSDKTNSGQPIQSKWSKDENDDGFPYLIWSETWLKPGRGIINMDVLQWLTDPNNPGTSSDVTADIELLTPDTDEYRSIMNKRKGLRQESSP